VQTFQENDSAVFRYACQEGNYAVPNILAVARLAERAESTGR
jgi:hypothetical protein